MHDGAAAGRAVDDQPAAEGADAVGQPDQSVTVGVGATPVDDAAWTRPWGSVVLAGEHTAGDRAATMNGAAASGARAARTVVDVLGRRADRRVVPRRGDG